MCTRADLARVVCCFAGEWASLTNYFPLQPHNLTFSAMQGGTLERIRTTLQAEIMTAYLTIVDVLIF
jgi:hypothetical protein